MICSYVELESKVPQKHGQGLTRLLYELLMAQQPPILSAM